METSLRNTPPVIYNLFPPILGDVKNWPGHVQRAAGMGFNWCFLNPIHLVGASGSLYAVRDYFELSPVFFGANSKDAQWSRFKRFVADSRDLGVEIMVDLVINHSAYDNPLTRDKREWYKLNSDGSIKNPGCKDNSAPGGWVVWGDLNEFDNEHSSARDELWEYWWRLVKKFIDVGVRGFRCDAAYQIPNKLWKLLITRAREIDPEITFFAESLGCSLEQTMGLVEAGHDFVFNSGKWWDYKAEWFVEQNNALVKKHGRSIAFPESHDTQRLDVEFNSDLDRIKQHYLFTALISSGVLIPIGFEYGFKKKLHVVHTNPYDYEGASYDLTDYIRQINEMKISYPLLSCDGLLEVVDSGSSRVLALVKSCAEFPERMLFVFNRTDADIELDFSALLGRVGAKQLGETAGEKLSLKRYGFTLCAV